MPVSTLFLYQTAVVLLLTGGLLSAMTCASARFSAITGSVSAITGSIAGTFAALTALFSSDYAETQLFWPGAGLELSLKIDALAAFFLVPIFLVLFLCALYAQDYQQFPQKSRQAGRHWLAFNWLGASMALVVAAADSLTFLFSWEIMALTSFLLIITNLRDDISRKAGWIYLTATHLGTAFIFFFFLSEYQMTGSLELSAFQGLTNHRFDWLFFFLIILGFGTKAGLFPLHSWLPEAHSAAPSHISALMSGVMIKTAVYAVLRLLTVLPPMPPSCGAALTGLGALSALFGIAMAATQTEIKRTLAYSTIENIGLIFLGIGLWLFLTGTGHEHAALLALAGALFHVWNHALFKSLLFFGAGAIIKSTAFREMSQLGGLMKRMPKTGLYMLFGGCAASALPPFNVFWSEWLLYIGLFEAGQASRGYQAFLCMLLILVLALTGGGVLLVMTRLLGTAFCGEPRSHFAAQAKESGRTMLGAMGIACLLCLLLGFLPMLVIRNLHPAMALLSRHGNTAITSLTYTLPMPINWAFTALGCTILLGLLTAAVFKSRRPDCSLSTWGCGYNKISKRMIYSAGSYGEFFQNTLLPAAMRATNASPQSQDLFPQKIRLQPTVSDPIHTRWFTPLFLFGAGLAQSCRSLQAGRMNIYLGYFFSTLILLLSWMFLS